MIRWRPPGIGKAAGRMFYVERVGVFCEGSEPTFGGLPGALPGGVSRGTFRVRGWRE